MNNPYSLLGLGQTRQPRPATAIAQGMLGYQAPQPMSLVPSFKIDPIPQSAPLRTMQYTQPKLSLDQALLNNMQSGGIQQGQQGQSIGDGSGQGQGQGQGLLSGLLTGPGSSERLTALGASLLSGPSRTPISLGSSLAKGLLAGNQAAREAEEAGLNRELLKIQMDLAKKKLGDDGSKEKKFSNEKDLRNEFNQQSKLYLQAFEGYNKVKMSATKEDPTGADDIALIFGFMKTIDPNSAVKEGEFATAQDTGSVPERVRSQYNKLVRGERLTQPQRIAFAKAAENQFQAIMPIQKDLESRYLNLAKTYNLAPDNIVESYTDRFEPLPDSIKTSPGSDFSPVGTPDNPQYVKNKEYADNLPVGTHIIFQDESGKLVRGIVE
jgi:hypothetical protein